MSRNEIRLRKKMMSTDKIQRYRNYSALMKQHQRANRFKRTVRIALYSLVATVIVLILLLIVTFFIMRLEKKNSNKNQQKTEANVEIIIIK
jgi:heme/copper-type cytochrome/quinol oxidase subunit 2